MLFLESCGFSHMRFSKFNANANAKKESNSEKAKALAKQLNEKADKKLKEEAQILIRDINVCLQSLQAFINRRCISC